MNYEASLRFKTNVVRESIRRIGGLENVVVHDTVGMEQPVNYRNKAQYPIGRYKDGIRRDFTQKDRMRLLTVPPVPFSIL